MRIAIINTLPIPSGEASVNRILSYSKELVAIGNDVVILSSGRPIEAEKGEISGVKYECLGANGKLRALYNVINRIKKDNCDFVIVVSNSLLLIYPLVLICWLNRITLIQEKSEFPFVLMRKGMLRQLYARFYVNTTYKLFDGLIVMTKPLMEYFKTKVRHSCKLFEMPMTVDVERFDISKTRSEFGDYIAYCGNMAGNKDGVMNLIIAFNMAAPRIENVNLLLIGSSTNKEDWNKIQKLVASLKNERIIFYGKADRNDIPLLLKNAKALALARPSGLQATGGFPTKLGEYLSTGNPVIVTKVGDIPRYLNESNAFVVEPDDNQAFADAIVSVFLDYDAALIKARKGQSLALSVFNAKVQANRLHEFLKSIK